MQPRVTQQHCWGTTSSLVAQALSSLSDILDTRTHALNTVMVSLQMQEIIVGLVANATRTTIITLMLVVGAVSIGGVALAKCTRLFASSDV